MTLRSILLAVLFCSLSAFAQQPGLVSAQVVQHRVLFAGLPTVSLCTREERSPATDALWHQACRTAEVLRYDEVAAQRLITSSPAAIRLGIPTGNGVVVLDLERADILADGFAVRRASDGKLVEPPPGLHFRGIIEGDSTSIVAVSVFGDEMMAVISDRDGQRVIGRFEKGPKGLHVLYRDNDLLATSPYTCSTPDLPAANMPHPHPATDGADRSTRCVRWYWEAAYDIFQNKGSMANTVNYITALFNQSATLFANDGVNVTLLETFVWDVPSPYNGSSSHARLYQFGTTRTSFNGDLAHLLDYGGYGGVAYISALCGGTATRMAYSGINSGYNNVPTYSWSVNVVTHEQGHNLGSNHTHACVWNGNNTAIDGCGPTAGYTEGSCPNAGLPAGGGTIMSYCHLIGGTGINFTKGFGPQPKQVIVDRTNAATCLQVCNISCDPPGLLSNYSLTQTGCTLAWANTGAVSYNLRWKEQSASTWNAVNGIALTVQVLTGLTPGTAYEFQVMAICANGQSAWSTSTFFTTPAPCPDALEPNDTWQTAAAITLPATINALIATAQDQDHYSFTFAGFSNINLSLSNLAANYDLYLLNSSGSVVASSTNTGTASEYIGYPAAPGTYTVRVVGQGGAFNGLQCYYLYVNAYTSMCPIPSGLGSSGITWSSADLAWDAIPQASSYQLNWKLTAGSTWNIVSSVATNSYSLAGLQPATAYDVQVRSTCSGPGGSQGGGASEFSIIHSFTTLAAPCDVQPPITVAVKMLLEGPYKQAEGLMVDSLRRQGVLPLTEPYTAMGFAITGQNATTTGVLAVTGANAIVDWVLVELRDAATGATVLERKVALLQRDGDVVSVDGVNPLGFCAIPGIYRVAVRHRNHLGCASAQGITLGAIAASVDFTSAALGTYGTEARKTSGAIRVLWAGNTTGDALVKYTGSGNDRDPILSAIGGTMPTAVVAGYLPADVNMDGLAKYTGGMNDRDPILVNVGSTLPSGVRTEQLP